MSLSDEQIQKLLEWFINSSETRRKWSEYRKKSLEENQKWVQPDVIQKISDKELETKFLEYYRTGGGRQSLNQINRDRIIRDKKRFRETILHLFDESIDIKNRINDTLGGKYRIEGFGKAIATSFLMDYNPAKYCLWNNKTEMGLSALGWKARESKDPWGTAYLRILETLQSLINLEPELKLTFDDIDLFLHTISAEDDGIQALKEISEGMEPGIADNERASEEIQTMESMEFIMEKYLEEFIETNFNKINLGAKLELYQDEENTGRQYPTSIGNIDLLAVDKEKKEFVVIELKKGKSSDAVIGQILRYMGWVKDNLAKDYDVRGIIIVKEKDERLRYALKLTPNVSLFLYEVSFNVKKIT